MNDKEKIKLLEEDIEFLVARADHAGACHFTTDRDTGLSSNSIVNIAYGMQGAKQKLPAHRKTPEVIAAMERIRALLFRRR